ncbi:MAG: tetratricopeptide repeat protein [Acidobacteria bacterium]|nr:tetratricopeptide repeat protein [Acidobacteriota bacterium]
MFRSSATVSLLWLAPVVAAQTHAPARVTYYGTIAPIVAKECSACHRPGESAPFPLLTYDQVRRHATQIARVVKTRFMPPWLPEHGYGEFKEERRLTDEQIRLFEEWAARGAPAGVETKQELAAPPVTSWVLGQPDLVLHTARPFKVAADAPETFWNFILPVPITATRWVRAIEIRPGNPQVFHHVNVIIDRAHAARRRESSPGSGFAGMDVIFEESSFEPDGNFLSWKPGSSPVVEPDGMAWRADPGMDLILNVHIKPTGKEETVDPVVGLYFTDKPRTLYPMLIQLEHDRSLDIPPGDKDFLVSDDFTVPMDLNVLAVYPHAHYLGHVMEGYATLPDGMRKWLVRIPNWDLNWQGVFRYQKPVFLPKGSVVSMRYHYDNSADNVRNPNSPPKEVKGGPDAKSEMGHLWLQVLPVEPGDHRAEIQAAISEQQIKKYPDDFTANFRMGDLMLMRNDPNDAIPYFQKAAESDPHSVVAATELGNALFAAKKVPESIEALRHALEIDATYTDARYNLASVLATSGKFEEAARQYEQVLKDQPDNQPARQHRAEVLVLWADQVARAGDDTKAIAMYREAMPELASNPAVHVRLGMAYARQERLDEAQAEFEAVQRLDPQSVIARQAIEAIAARRKATGK